MSYVGIIITFAFINNFILTQFLGLCPFIGVSRKTDSAVGMGFAVIFVMSLASLITWAIYRLVLVPLGIAFLQTIAFILVILDSLRTCGKNQVFYFHRNFIINKLNLFP